MNNALDREQLVTENDSTDDQIIEYFGLIRVPKCRIIALYH